jgi:hypothetical protein
VALGIGDGRYAERGTVENRLSEDDVVDLYLWLEHHFPMAEDRKHEAGVARFVTPRDQVARWRNNIIRDLKERGTRAAVTALERILKHLPEHRWLNWTLREAREVTRRKTWRPLTPQQVIEMAARPEARLIRGLDQLLELVIESLERLDAAMQGETPVAPLLWNESSTGCYRPKDEDHLSDLVRWHLSTDLRGRGLNLNREPVIRRGEGKSKGERIDILVEVAVPNLGETLEQVGLIIEVKGCWNKEVNTALEQQLVERYLADNPARLGLYLVGWFMCPQWDKQDHRRTQTPKMTLGEARAFFDSQALKASEAGLKVRAFVLNTALR